MGLGRKPGGRRNAKNWELSACGSPKLAAASQAWWLTCTKEGVSTQPDSTSRAGAGMSPAPDIACMGTFPPPRPPDSASSAVGPAPVVPTPFPKCIALVPLPLADGVSGTRGGFPEDPQKPPIPRRSPLTRLMGGPPQHCPRALPWWRWPALSQTPQLVPGSSVPTLKSSVVLEQGTLSVLLHWALRIWG